VADQHDSIDLRTLEQVQHLLATTTFASIDDVAGRTADLSQVGNRPDPAPRSRTADAGATLVDSAGAAPLPRRR
jgi:hypothetical protein